MSKEFIIYLIVMAGVTYLVRMLPFLLIKSEIKNEFILSFLHYMPYAVLAVMTIPGIFFATTYTASAVVGFIVAVILALRGKDLTTVACFSCVGVLIAELFITYVM